MMHLCSPSRKENENKLAERADFSFDAGTLNTAIPNVFYENSLTRWKTPGALRGAKDKAPILHAPRCAPAALVPLT